MLCSLSREGRTCSYTTQTHCPVLSWLHSKMKEIARVRETVFLLLLVPNGPSEYRLGEHPLLKRLHAQAIWSWSPKHLWKHRRTEIQDNTSKYLGHSRFVPEAPVYLFFFFFFFFPPSVEVQVVRNFLFPARDQAHTTAARPAGCKDNPGSLTRDVLQGSSVAH